MSTRGAPDAHRFERGVQIAVKAEEIEIALTRMKTLNSTTMVERLVVGGVSRLTAERIVAIERGSAEPGRARAHTTSRR